MLQESKWKTYNFSVVDCSQFELGNAGRAVPLKIQLHYFGV